MAILNNGFFRSGFYARAYRKLTHSIYVNDLWLDLRLHAKREAVDYVIANMPEAMVLPDRERLLRFALSRAPADGFIAEFGVAKGDSLRNLAAHTTRPVHGFDSFGGLPEDWGGTKETAGAFTNQGKLPRMPANVTLHVGWFDQTVPRFLATSNDTAAFLHIDCDIYSSTVTVLGALRDRIVSGTVILFDEYFNYPGWRGHEYKAFQEFIAESGKAYKYLALSGEKGHVAAMIL